MNFSRRIITALFLAILAVTGAGCYKKPDAAQTNPPASANTAGHVAPAQVALPNFTALVKNEGPAVINISTVKKVRAASPFPGLSPDDPLFEYFHRFMPDEQMPREFLSQSLGSGFIISADGYVLTNEHVVEDADEVTVRLTDEREFKAKVIGADRRSDIALLKISASGLPVVNIGDSSRLEVGEWVVAIGSPFGFTNSISQGIVSAKGRNLPGENIVPFIQTDVPVNPGNSGGPLFNLNGEVVGINSQIYSRSGGYMGLSFAIPINLAMKVKDELLKHGMVRRGWLGIAIQTVSADYARSFRLAKAGGALIAAVENSSPAQRAGLQIGDIILKFDGREIAGAEDLTRAVADAAPDSRVKLQVWRDGAARELAIRLGEVPDERTAQKLRPPEQAEMPNQIGLALHELSRDEQRELHTDGFLLVEEVAGVAAESGVEPGDIILAVNSQRVASVKQLRMVLTQFGKRAALLVQREDSAVFIPLKFKEE